jgi:ATP-dependent Clp protease ATP-binding subunit ClpA
MAVLDKIRAHPRSVLLLDEIEKAHPKALSIVNDILLTRSTTLSNGHDLDFESAMVVITAGIDRDTLKKMLAKAGLHSRKLPKGQSIEDALETALPKAIVFKPISEDTLKDHIRQRIADISKRIRAERGATLDISEAAVKDMATRLEPEVAKLGLRPVRALIDREVVSPLVKIILRGNIPLAATVDMRNGSLEVSAKSIAPANGPAINPR